MQVRDLQPKVNRDYYANEEDDMMKMIPLSD